jgi:hypothetical protein
MSLNRNKTNDAFKNPHAHSAWIDFFSGATAGFADTMLNYPPYGIKIRMQRKEIKHWKEIFTGKFYYPTKLYQGIIPAGISIIPATIMQDGVSSIVRNYSDSGAGAACIGGLAGAPLATIMANVIVRQQKEGLTPLAATKAIQSEGWARFFRGFVPTAKRDTIYAAGAFWGVNAIKKQMPNSHPLTQAVVASVVTGGIVTVLSHPADTIATMLQDSLKSQTLSEVTTGLAKTNGVRGFYAGVFFRGYSVIAGMLTVSTVSEKTKEVFTSFRP